MATILEVIDTLQKETNSKVNQSGFARALNITRATVSARVKSGSQVTYEEIQKLEKVYNVDLKPKKLSPETKEAVTKQLEEIKECIEKIQNKQKPNKNQTKDSGDCVMVPVRGNVTASMGYGLTVYDETQTGTYAINNRLAKDLGINLNKSEIIFAKGDSMEPTIIGGDSLLVDLTRKEIHDGSIYCVRIDGEIYAKRLQKLPPDKIKVISDNQEKYDAFYIDLSKDLNFDFEVIGEVRWWGRVAK